MSCLESMLSEMRGRLETKVVSFPGPIRLTEASRIDVRGLMVLFYFILYFYYFLIISKTFGRKVLFCAI